jgi:hypothetical protein
MKSAARCVLACLFLAGCASTTLERSERAVAPAPEQHAWRPAVTQDLDGLFVSVEIEGPIAAVLREVHYSFASDGRFSGAALVPVPRPTFQTLEGRWTLEDGVLRLGEGNEAARAEVDGDLLRLSGSEGRIALRRRPMP